MSKIGVVVPTLGKRREWLLDSLKSIQSAGADYVVVVTPDPSHEFFKTHLDLFDEVIADEGLGQVEALKLGLSALVGKCDYFNWINDDDELLEGAYFRAKAELGVMSPIVMFGDCQYVDAAGRALGMSKFGRAAVKLIGWGPDLVPSPSCLFSLKGVQEIGGLAKVAGLAVDYDLLIRCKKTGRQIVHIPDVWSRFRWHAGSLTVSRRHLSVLDASRARLRNVNPKLKWLQLLFEPLVLSSTYIAGLAMSFRAKLQSKHD